MIISFQSHFWEENSCVPTKVFAVDTRNLLNSVINNSKNEIKFCHYMFSTIFTAPNPVTVTFDNDAFTLTGPSPCNIRILPSFRGSIVPTSSKPSMPVKLYIK